MRHSVVRITDKTGTSFRMKLATTTTKGRLAAEVGEQVNKRILSDFTVGRKALAWVRAGDWETEEKGFIRYHSGKTRSRLSGNGDLTTRDLLILGPDGVKTYDGDDLFGMQLFEYEDALGVNDEGEGTVHQPWVLSIVPGRIRWKVVE